MVKLTAVSRYALQAVVFLATQKHNGPIASHHIAQATGVPEKFLLKALKPLANGRVLRSLKGPNGGYRLVKAPKEITLLEIIESVDRPIRGEVFPINGEEGNGLIRKLEPVFNEAAESVRRQLQKVKISDLIGKS